MLTEGTSHLRADRYEEAIRAQSQVLSTWEVDRAWIEYANRPIIDHDRLKARFHRVREALSRILVRNPVQEAGAALEFTTVITPDYERPAMVNRLGALTTVEATSPPE